MNMMIEQVKEQVSRMFVVPPDISYVLDMHTLNVTRPDMSNSGESGCEGCVLFKIAELWFRDLVGIYVREVDVVSRAKCATFQ